MTKHMKSKPLFNQQQALEIANDDQQIVEHLRTMFLQSLPEQLQIAKQLYQNRQTKQLQQHLHQLLGSAKVCAAEPLADAIIKLKQQLEQQTQQLEWQDFKQQIKQLMALL